MDTQPAEAVANDANAPVEATTPEAFFEDLAKEQFGLTDEQEEDAPAEGAEEQSDATEEAEDDPDIEQEADDLPAIEAPVSWDAEAKETFKNLPREAQEIVAKRESERERFVQTKSQEAARAKQEAEQSALQQLAQYDAAVAQQYQQLAAQLAPQAPDPSILRVNPEAFYAAEADYRAKTAQQQQLQQQANEFAQQAQLRASQAEQAANAEQHRIIVDNFPEYADPTTGPELRSKLSAVAKELGYPDELINQARASDILAMKQAAEWRTDAIKYRELMKTKMEKVRSAKGKPPVTTRPGVALGTDQVRQRNKSALAETLTTSKNRDVQGSAFYELAKANGWVS